MELVLRLVVLAAVMALAMSWLQARNSGHGCLLPTFLLGLMVLGGRLLDEPYNVVVVCIYTAGSAFVVRLVTTYLRAIKRGAAAEARRPGASEEL